MAKRKKRPAFQYYPQDFLSDVNVGVMNTEEIGAYWLLVSHCWIEGSLPLDFPALERLARVNEGWFNENRRVLFLKCFSVLKSSNPPKLFHRRLRKEEQKQIEWERKSREGGIKSGQSRRKKPKGGSKGGSRVVEPKGNSSSSSSSSSSKEDLVSREVSRERENSDAKKHSLSDSFLDAVQAKPVYQQLEVRHVAAKMTAWCEVKGKEPTRDRLINWLNREIPPRKENDKDVDDRGSAEQIARVAARIARGNH